MMSKQLIICKSEDLQEKGGGVRFTIPEKTEQSSAFVVRFEGKAYGFMNQCAHLPVELDWNEGDFFTKDQSYLICATHGAQYDPKTGHCISGPCQGKTLKQIAVTEQGGVVSITLDQI